ncbi:hypothetical protein D1BOALGB6SA_1352 [Olavius sp. associated proteobacterium Delta 1]|nr:hypothetical protein D1BOALGB6SA_1352 [Olavius sp. associated proteobacterium Delta 1]
MIARNLAEKNVGTGKSLDQFKVNIFTKWTRMHDFGFALLNI